MSILDTEAMRRSNAATQVRSRFNTLFAGLNRAYGTSKLLGETRLSGKVETDNDFKRGEVTEKLWDLHHSGEQCLGIVPIRDDGTCTWACLDIDVYRDRDMVAEVNSFAKEHGLPLVVCRSKSGGAHAFLFFSEPVHASDARATLTKLIEASGLPADTEVFPKQSRIAPDEMGSYLNLPYFGGTEHGRYCIDWNSGILGLAEFVEYAESRRMDRDKYLGFKALLRDIVGDDDNAPVLTANAAQRIAGRDRARYFLGSEGNRNEAQLYLAGRLAHDPHMLAENKEFIFNAVAEAQFGSGWERSEKGLTAMRKRMLGTWNVEAVEDEFNSLTVIKPQVLLPGADEVRYVLMYRGIPVDIPNAKTLASYRLTKVEIIKCAGQVPRVMTEAEWSGDGEDAVLTKLLANALETTEEESQGTLIWRAVVDWLNDCKMTEDPAEFRRHTTTLLAEDGILYVRPRGLESFVNSVLRGIPYKNVTAVLTAKGGRRATITRNGKRMRAWQFDEDVIRAEPDVDLQHVIDMDQGSGRAEF